MTTPDFIKRLAELQRKQWTRSMPSASLEGVFLIPIDTFTCTVCHQQKPRQAFGANKHTHAPYKLCKACQAAYAEKAKHRGSR